MRPKTADVAPIPIAKVSTARAVKPGFLVSWRKAKRRSFILSQWQKVQSPDQVLERTSSGGATFSRCSQVLVDEYVAIFKNQRLSSKAFRPWEFVVPLSGIVKITQACFRKPADARSETLLCAKRTLSPDSARHCVGLNARPLDEERTSAH